MGGQTSHLKKIFNYFDPHGKQYITIDDVLQIYKESKHCKYQKYFNIIFYNFFSGGVKKDAKLDFITFLQYVLINKQSAVILSESENLNTSHSTILNEITQVSQSYSELSQQKIMHSDAKSRDISSIAMMLDNMRKKQTQFSDVLSFNELLGLHIRDSSELVFRREYLDDQNLYMRQYITEQDLALLLDFLADKQISIQHLLGQESVIAHRSVLEKIDFQNNDQKQQFAKILLNEYDITNTGKLSDVEYSKLIEVIQYELQTHMAFMGLHTTKIKNYLIGKTIGFGRTAICKCGIKSKDQDNKLYCLKIMKQQQLRLQEQMGPVNSSQQQQNNNYCKQIPEKQIMDIIKKAFGSQQINILIICDYFTYTDKLGEEWDVLVTEMCSGGNLAEYNKTTITTEQIARYLFYQIVLGVQQAHAVGIAHLDLRLENVLLNDKGDIRLCDFGNALLFDLEQPYEGKFPINMRAGTIAGTLANMPPEMLESSEDFSAEAVDIYCLGLILYELLTKKKAFHCHGNDDQQLISAIINSEYVPLKCGFTNEAVNLVQSLLTADFRQRPTIHEILESPFLQLEMHKPAIARGVILLDPAPKLAELEQALEQCCKQQGFTYKVLDTPNSPNTKCLLTWDLASVHLNLKITCEEVKELGPGEDDLLLAARAVQTEVGRRQLENVVLSSFKRGESAYKLVLSLKNGGLQDFQLIFKRIRYQLLQNFSSLIDQQQQLEMNENPVIESIMYKQDVAKEFVFDSAGPNDSLNDLVNQTIAEADEGTIIS